MTGTAERFAIILAGGRGERFWPLSTSRNPKQFLRLVEGKPLVALSVERVLPLIPAANIYIITSNDLVAVAREAAPMIPAANVIGEPDVRDTAAAIALGAGLVARRSPNAVIAVLTADHIIGDRELFQQTISNCLELASGEDVLITIGIQPTEPSSAFGYIEAGDSKTGPNAGTHFFQAQRFVEKPDREKAEAYLASGKFYWNSGMFIWSLASITKAFRQHRPQLFEMINQLQSAPAYAPVIKELYPKLEKVSIDYAIMEKADNIVVAAGTFSWDDVGSWTALENHFPADKNGNVAIGQSFTIDAHNNVTYSEKHLTALLGVSDLIVVHSEHATLVCHKDQAQNLKKLVQGLKATGQYNNLL